MRESISYTVTLNFAITFIVIVFAFLSATLIYYKSNKVSNIITNSIEKYEGYNNVSEGDIYIKLFNIGYNMERRLYCDSMVKASKNSTNYCKLIIAGNDAGAQHGYGDRNYCVYLCEEEEYYYYKIRTNIMFNLPIVNELLNIPIYSDTNRLYDFGKILGD